MQSYRKRIAVQKQPVKHKAKQRIANVTTKKRYPDVKNFLLRAIWVHEEVLKQFKPMSDEWALCLDELSKYKADLEQLEGGTFEVRKEVIEKYGG